MVEVMYSFNRLPKVNANRFFQSIPWQHRCVVVFLFLFMGLFANSTALAQINPKTSRWIVVRDGGFTLYTDAGTAAARTTLERVRTMTAVFKELGRSPRESNLRIVLFKSDADFAEYRPHGHQQRLLSNRSGRRLDWFFHRLRAPRGIA